MSHIKSIFFENYRIFKHDESFDLQPITFLTGPNSSGKSSIFKALLLLKNNITSDLQILDFSGTKHNLGSFENTLNNSKHSDEITFGFEASINDDYSFSYSKVPFTSKRSVINLLVEDSENEVDIKLLLTYKKNDNSGRLKVIEVFKKDDANSFLKLEIGEITDEHHKLKMNYDTIVKNKILKKIFVENVIRDKFKNSKSIDSKTYKIPVKIKINEISESKYFDEPILVFSNLMDGFLKENFKLELNRDFHQYLRAMPLKRLLKDFSALIENFEYIEAVRANTKRLYTSDSQGTSFNELILEYRSREISEKALEFTNKWLKNFEIADEIVFENIEGVATTIFLVNKGKQTALADLGYGITQFLPIILKISLEEPINNNPLFYNVIKKTILLEEPETNLHPKLQSLLADFIIDALKTFEIRFIIETHSEYIIRKLQILTAEKIITPQDSVIYYFNNPNTPDIKQIIKININENGSLTEDFGEGFFDESTNLKYELLKHKSKSL